MKMSPSIQNISLAIMTFVLSSCVTASIDASDKTPAPLKIVKRSDFVSDDYVIVKFTIDRNGRTKDHSIVESSDKKFNNPSINAIKKWKYKPQTKDGKLVEVQQSVRLNFEEEN